MNRIISISVHATSKNILILGSNMFLACLECIHYGVTSYGMSRPGIQNEKDFCIKINIPKRKLFTFENWTNGEPQQLAKIRVLKLIISFFHFFCAKIETSALQWHKMNGKNIHIYFLRFLNKWVWAEKIRKDQKNFKT